MIRAPQKIKMINLGEILPNPYQTRRRFDRKELALLSESIKRVGVLSPIILRGGPRGYEIICGQRRVRAAIMAGLREIPAIIVRAGDLQCSLLSLIENIHRVPLSVSEEAEGYFNLLAYHRVKKEKLPDLLSVENPRIREKMRILSLPDSVRNKIEEGNIPQKAIEELVKFRDEEKQLEVAEKIINEELNHTSLKEEVKAHLRKMALKKSGRPESPQKNTALYINTVKRTVKLLENSGAKVEFEQKEDENYIEFRIKTRK